MHRRIVSIFLLLVSSLGLAMPLVSAAAPEPSSLPACCRKDGKHRCAMMQERSASPRFTPRPCAQYPEPGKASFFASQPLSIAGASTVVPTPPLRTLARFAPLDSLAISAHHVTHRDRGPPSFLR